MNMKDCKFNISAGWDGKSTMSNGQKSEWGEWGL